jgi:chromosome segregation ATPase
LEGIELDIDRRLSEVKINIEEKQRLETKLKIIEDDLRAARDRKNEFEKQLIKEEKDVKRLEGISLANLLHSIKGDKSDKLYEERREAIAAKVKYDDITGEIKRLKEELEEINSRILSFGNLQEEYLRLIEEKGEIIKAGNYPQNDELERLMNEEVNIKSKEREINEAINAGNELLYSLDIVKDILDSASGWGVWDMLGGGFISTMAKHSDIDEAQEVLKFIRENSRI